MFGVDEFVFGAPQPEEVSQRQQEQDGHPPEGVPLVRPVTLEELTALPSDQGAIQGSDWYVVDKDFTWTYAQTHEDECGPYFCRCPENKSET